MITEGSSNVAGQPEERSTRRFHAVIDKHPIIR